MKVFILITIFFLAFFSEIKAQETPADFQWGNGFYFNIDQGETITFRNTGITLLKLHNHYNQLKIGEDTLWIKVSRRSLPVLNDGLRIFVADNKHLKALSKDKGVHGLLKKDALICLSDFSESLLDFNQFAFPVSFNDGFIWSTEEDSYLFSYEISVQQGGGISGWLHSGIDFDLHDVRGLEKHWLLAVESGHVAWVEEGHPDQEKQEACLLVESIAQPGIFYLYEHLNKRNVIVRNEQKLVRGEPLGTIWGDESWGHLQFTVLKSDTIPSYADRHKNVVNGFPQVYELYFKETSAYFKTYSRGRVYFGRHRSINGNQKNVMTYESYAGKGWKPGEWNISGKVEAVQKGEEGNARLKKVLFEGTKAERKNPENFYEYEINVRNGLYRIRAKVGDLFVPTWQKVNFEDLPAGEISLDAGEFEWTTERVVKVEDGRLTVRIYVDEKNQKAAGLGQIVFQGAN